MRNQILYIELKSGFSHNGPAWIGFVKLSKTGQTIYFNNKALKKFKNPGINANYYDIENGDEYWISGVKKNGLDRYKYGNGEIMLDKNCINEYLRMINKANIDLKKFKLVDFEKTDLTKFTEIENLKVMDHEKNPYYDNNYNKLNRNKSD